MVKQDFVDVFLTLRLIKGKRSYGLVHEGNMGYSYVGMPFGVESAPLIWGRVAGLMSRSAQATAASHDTTRILAYVGDPVVVVARTEEQRNLAAA